MLVLDATVLPGATTATPWCRAASRNSNAVRADMQPLMDAQTKELPPLIDHDAMSDWCGGVYDEDVLAILSGVPDELTGCVADIENAIARANPVAVKSNAHRLKGMAGNVGAARLARIARGIELGSQSIEGVSQQMEKLRETVTETLAALRTITCRAP